MGIREEVLRGEERVKVHEELVKDQKASRLGPGPHDAIFNADLRGKGRKAELERTRADFDSAAETVRNKSRRSIRSRIFDASEGVDAAGRPGNKKPTDAALVPNRQFEEVYADQVGEPKRRESEPEVTPVRIKR
jgi:hypothetical protein